MNKDSKKFCSYMVRSSFIEYLDEDIIDFKLAYERQCHMIRVRKIAKKLVKNTPDLNLTKKQLEDLEMACYIHDVRKFSRGDHGDWGYHYVLKRLIDFGIKPARAFRISNLVKMHNKKVSYIRENVKNTDDLILYYLIKDSDTLDKIVNQGKDRKRELILKSSINLVEKNKELFTITI